MFCNTQRQQYVKQGIHTEKQEEKPEEMVNVVRIYFATFA